MAKTISEVSYRTYGTTWVILLGLTLVMLGLGRLSLPQALLAGLLLVGMLGKASLIGAYFMHLRFEKLSLVLVVTLAILATASFLFGLIAFDGLRILRLSSL